MIERSEYQQTRIGETLPPAIKPLLARLGVWDQFISEHHSPSFSIRSAWGREEIYENDFIFNPYGTGWHVDRQRFDAMLALAAERAGARVHRGGSLISCLRVGAGDWELDVKCGDGHCAYRTSFFVDATGRASSFSRGQGAKRISYDRLIGVVGFCPANSAEIAPHHYTLVEAVAEGWWYSALLPNFQFVAAYMTDADLHARGSGSIADYWQEQIVKAPHTRSRLNSCTLESNPHIFAAGSSRMDRMTGGTWLVVGDAAATYDPLSSQGVYKALESGLRAARAIGDYWAGHETSLMDYALTIKGDFEEYLLTRDKFYSREGRWPHSLFWRRRQGKRELA
jgi:flavin-dependent dehydrogenase